MAIQYQDFIHPSDKKALDALKAVPGFDSISKKFMNLVGEKIFMIETTSSYLKLGPNQLPEIYNSLVKVCRKLQIKVPALYLSLDRSPNARTMGDTDVFIVLHSGLLETMTLEQIETVIAHECGHIVCHHVLYHTMGRFILNGAEMLAKGWISGALLTSLQYAFYYWMRCSEFSADRVSAYYHESAEPVINVMMALAGGTNNLQYELNREEFFNQAKDYKVLIDGSVYNKVLEFIRFGEKDHPLNAYRAYEINEFYKKYKVKLLSQTTNSSQYDIKKYNLTIKYECIKPKSLLKLGGIFDTNKLEVTIQNTTYYIDKNNEKEIKLKNGKYNLSITNGIRKIQHFLDLRYDMKIVISWDSDNETISVREEF